LAKDKSKKTPTPSEADQVTRGKTNEGRGPREGKPNRSNWLSYTPYFLRASVMVLLKTFAATTQYGRIGHEGFSDPKYVQMS
jgi:hypothetical protein